MQAPVAVGVDDSLTLLLRLLAHYENRLRRTSFVGIVACDRFFIAALLRMPAGTLDVYLDCAKGLKDTEIIGKADPYVVLKAGKATGKTATCKDQGSVPVWGEKISLHIASGCKQLVLTIYNENTFYKDDIMGTTTITLSEVFDVDNQLPDGTFLSPSADYPVTRLDGKGQGQIRLALVFEEDDKDQKNTGY